MTGMVIHDSKGRAYTEDEIAAIREELERRAEGDCRPEKLVRAIQSPDRVAMASYDRFGTRRFCMGALDHPAVPRHRLSIPEMIAEWRKGCSNASAEHPEQCHECTTALINAIETHRKQALGDC